MIKASFVSQLFSSELGSPTPSSLLFIVTSVALPWDFYFFKLTQPLTVSTTVKEKGGKPDRKPYPLPYGLRNPYRNLKSENSQDYSPPKFSVHEFGFWIGFGNTDETWLTCEKLYVIWYSVHTFSSRLTHSFLSIKRSNVCVNRGKNQHISQCFGSGSMHFAESGSGSRLLLNGSNRDLDTVADQGIFITKNFFFQ